MVSFLCWYLFAFRETPADHDTHICYLSITFDFIHIWYIYEYYIVGIQNAVGINICVPIIDVCWYNSKEKHFEWVVYAETPSNLIFLIKSFNFVKVSTCPFSF